MATSYYDDYDSYKKARDEGDFESIAKEYHRLLKEYKDAVSSGGYSQQELQDIRERGVSPIRSVYASAQRGLDRQRGLQGGYSPNYNAVQAKMAREQSAGISDAMTNINAGIARDVVEGRTRAREAQSGILNGLASLYSNRSRISYGDDNTDSRDRTTTYRSQADNGNTKVNLNSNTDQNKDDYYNSNDYRNRIYEENMNQNNKNTQANTKQPWENTMYSRKNYKITRSIYG